MTTLTKYTLLDKTRVRAKSLIAEFRRAFLLEWRYPLEALGKIVILYLLFRAITWGGSMVGPALNVEAFQTGQTERLVGYTLFFLLISALQNGANLIRNEAELGVFEQVYLSPLGLATIIITRGISTILASMLPMLLLFGLGVWTLGLSITQITPWIVVALFFGAVGMQGIGLMLSGIALIFKRSQSVLNLLTLLLLIVSVIPTSDMTGIGHTLATWFPFTQSIRLTALEIRGVATAPEQYLILAVSASLLFSLGLLVFRSMERLVLDRGSMGHY